MYGRLFELIKKVCYHSGRCTLSRELLGVVKVDRLDRTRGAGGDAGSFSPAEIARLGDGFGLAHMEHAEGTGKDA